MHIMPYSYSESPTAFNNIELVMSEGGEKLCDVCGESFTSNNKRKAHMRTVHEGIKEPTALKGKVHSKSRHQQGHGSASKERGKHFAQEKLLQMHLDEKHSHVGVQPSPQRTKKAKVVNDLEAHIRSFVVKAGDDPVNSMSLSEFHSPLLPHCLFELGLENSLVTLDLSRNEFSELPSTIGTLQQLCSLNVSRNFLKSLPVELAQLTQLTSIDVSSNDLRPNGLSLAALATLPLLRGLDLRHNNHIWEPSHQVLLADYLAGVSCPITLREPKEAKSHAADRDATQLRSQLEPFSTGTLRRRLSLVFGDTTNPEEVERGELMDRLLACYEKSGPRAIRKVQGIRVSDGICDLLLAEMTVWAKEDEKRTMPRERLTINAAHYMIITSPKGFSTSTGAKAIQAQEKLAKHARMWELARQALEEVDPEFASRYTAVAFTKNFVGSPHIDTQNIATFRGLALGDFSEDGGALAVECSAREVAHIDTRRRMGKLDGRYPHWVAPYSEGDRYSVIYYQTMGAVEERTTAVFSDIPPLVPDDPTTYCKPEDKYYNRYDRERKVYEPLS